MNKIQIYVSTYGKKAYQLSKGRIPIEVGAICRDKDHRCIYACRDDNGDNISSENEYYGELTGLYWIWKNTDSEYVGIEHFNKHLNISEKTAVQMLSGRYDFIVTRKGQLVSHAFQDEYLTFLDVLEEYDAEFYRVYTTMFSHEGSGVVSGKNMFATTRGRLNDYCAFLFPLLDMVHNRIGDTGRNAYHKRYCAFFAERLLTPYLIYSGLSYKEVPCKMVGPWYYRVVSKIYHSRLHGYIPDGMKPAIQTFLRRSSYGKHGERMD